jgi:hypothetical protein
MDDVLIGKIYEIIYTSVLIGSIYDTRPLNGRLSIRNSILWMNEIVTSGRDGARRITMACTGYEMHRPQRLIPQAKMSANSSGSINSGKRLIPETERVEKLLTTMLPSLSATLIAKE